MAENGSNENGAPIAGTPPAPAAGSAGGRRHGRATTLLRAIQFTSVVVVLLLVAVAAYYYFYATQQQEYLAARNIRALVTISSRVDATLAAAEQVLRNLDTSGKTVRRSAMFGDLSIRMQSDTGATAPSGLQRGVCSERVTDSSAIGNRVTKWTLRDDSDGACIERTFLAERSPRQYGRALLSTRIFSWIVAEPVERHIIESAMLVDSSGIVLVQGGSPELEVHRLDELIKSGIVMPEVKGSPPPPKPEWRDIRQNASRIPILISGMRYELFIQPCCHQGSSLIDRGFVVAGLIRSNGLRKQSLQISYSLVALIVAGLLLGATTMPFLKLQLVGPLQRIRPTDVVLLAFCSILSASLLSVVALDMYAYGKFRRDLDVQLVQLGDSIAAHMSREFRLIDGQLRSFVAAQLVDDTTSMLSTDLLRTRDAKEFTYPLFESWTMIDSTGKQTKKWSFDKTASSLVPVKGRSYFLTALAGGTWDAGRLEPVIAHADDSTMYTVESIQSWTTGKRQAILAIPTRQHLPVAAMTVDLASVIDPIIAPNFTFAVIDSTGKVLFHSDKRRNLQENIFAETDQNRAIRSAVFSRTSVSVGLKYGGDDRRAYVRPVAGLPWSVVTFRDENALRVTNLETIGTTVYLVFLYATVMVILGLVHIIARRRRMSWLWPDRTRGEDYIRLASAYAMLLGAFLLALATLSDTALLSAAILLPLQSVVLTWGVLRLSPSEWLKDAVSTWRRHRQWPLVAVVWALLAFTTISGSDKVSAMLLMFLVALAVIIALGPRDEVAHRLEPLVRRWPTSRRYLLGATLLLLLVCVLPAIGFFQVAYRVHTQAFVRHGQLRMALALDSRGRRIDQLFNDTTGFNKSALRAQRLCTDSLPICAFDLYQDIFFATKTATDTSGLYVDDRNHSEWLGLLRMPYDAENSVERRALIHEVADDGTWRSAVTGRVARLSYRSLGGDSQAFLSSRLPALTPSSLGDVVWLLILAFALPALTWAGAAFVSRRLYLLDLLDARPFGELGEGERTGRNLIVICRSPQELEDWGSTVDILEANIEGTGQNVRVLFPPVEDAAVDGRERQERRFVALERLVLSRHAVVVVLIPRFGDEPPLRDLLELFGDPQRSLAERERLARLIERFIVIDAARTAGAADMPGPNTLTTTTTELARSALTSEEAGDPELRKLWSGIAHDLADGSIYAESYGANPEMLDRLGERAESYYESIWATCSRAERAVMVHLAEDGFANSKDHDVLRRLLTRGLVRRTPRIALLNETFRRFVIQCGSAEEAIAERKRELSVWDGVRLPIIMLMLVVLTFFLVTQQQFFNTVTAVLAGVVTGLPAFVRLASWVSERRQPS